MTVIESILVRGQPVRGTGQEILYHGLWRLSNQLKIYRESHKNKYMYLLVFNTNVYLYSLWSIVLPLIQYKQVYEQD